MKMDSSKLQDLVAKAAALHMDKVAVTFDSGTVNGGCVSLLYSDIVVLGNELTNILQKHCFGNNGVIVLYCNVDLYLPVWILGILQLPAAYVPLDPDAPGPFSVHIMNQCGAQFCALQSDLLEQFQRDFFKLITTEVCATLSKYNLTIMRVQLLSATVQKLEAELKVSQGVNDTESSTSATRAMSVEPGDLAYVLHTSGTTGHPKIVRVPHNCIVPNILDLRALFQMCAEDVVFLASSLTFDPSVVEIFLALSSGAQLLIVPTILKKTSSRLSRLLFKNHSTTLLQLTPTLLGRFGHSILKQEVLSASSSLRVLVLGGEACPSPVHLRSWRQEGNKTNIYNIYGITEVSCWACCYKVPENLLQSGNAVESSVPLGSPLMGTIVEVRDANDCLITEGEGQVFIGGEDRVCLLDNELTLVPGTMRATGDWVEVKETELFYLGRRDRQIKRHGQRVNMDTLQQVVMSLPQVESCAVGLYKGFRLVAFVVTCGDQKATFPLPSVQQQAKQIPSASRDHLEDFTSSMENDEEKGLHKAVLHQLSLLLPSYSIPDTVMLVPALPMSSHGKVDTEALLKLYQTQREKLASGTCLDGPTKLKQTLTTLWQDVLGLANDAAIKEESNFLFSGGDSLKALRFCDDVSISLGVSSPGLLKVILDGSFSDVLHHVASVSPMLPFEDMSTRKKSRHRGGSKRRTDTPASSLTKRERPGPCSVSCKNGTVKVIRRAGEVVEMTMKCPASDHSQVDTMGELKESSKDTDKINLLTIGTNDKGDVGSSAVAKRELDLRLNWSSDTGRCVDASPVLLVQDLGAARPKTTVFIGSHSHRMQALDLATGGLLWERVLGDRIESSAAVTQCGALVVVGCYDGCVYFLCTESGETRWVFATGDAVKSSPTVDPLNGLVIVGSHDSHVYALNPEVCKCVWKHYCGGGAVFSSPFLSSSHRALYVASLGGCLHCLNPDSGVVLWTYSRETPFFSSPSCVSSNVVLGSVDGNVCCLSDSGQLVWQYMTKGPVFSSPCVTPDQQRVLCGSHDCFLYCLNCADGSLAWSFQTSGKVYASPCVFEGSTFGMEGFLVCVASTDGTLWILDGQAGTLVASLTLPGELFSSPVVWKDLLVVGCRNDSVYCVEMTDKKQVHSNS